MDHDAIKVIEAMPASVPVMISRAVVGAGLFTFLITAYIVQARDRIDRANRNLRHLAAAHRDSDSYAWTRSFTGNDRRRAA